MDDTSKKPAEVSGVSRRTFLGAAGLAASAAFIGPIAKLAGDTPSGYYYLNSFGDVVPVSQDLIDLGVFPPPLPEGVQNPGEGQEAHRKRGPGAIEGFREKDRSMDDGSQTAPVSGYPAYNILLIMVDQLRTPRWFPPGGLTAMQALIPNITALGNVSFSFQNFFVNATACTPSRSTLLTGLYTQQTCQFRTQATPTCEPDLNTNFQNIASVLTQASLGMQAFWVGKWHLSDPYPGSGGMGARGPEDYQFYVPIEGQVNLPTTDIGSPNGGGNTGTEGYNPAPGAFNHATSGTPPPNTSPLGNYYYNDAAICDYFLNTTAPYLASLPNSSSNRWFAAVSFLNPHDITQFPYFYDLSNHTHFVGNAVNHPTTSYPPPLTTGSPGNGAISSQNYGDTYLPALNSIYATDNTMAPTNWNYNDPLTGYGTGGGKPDMQTVFKHYISNMYGYTDGSEVSWSIFLNYYFWMQSCVDFQIGRVLQYSPPAVLDNSIIVFLSDHGEYGGSHGLHAKAGAIYDEAINVPLYVSYPSMRTGAYGSGTAPITVPYVCSMVDLLPFFYSQSLGNDFNWRTNPSSVISYLSGRESITDAIYGYSHSSYSYLQQRRLSQINYQNGNYAGQHLQPYILTTTDEFGEAVLPNGTSVPPHIVGFRTVDLTVQYVNADGNTVYGGGKLGVYSFWPPIPGSPNSSNVDPTLTQPLSANQQYEFYDYSNTRNYPELGNEWTTNPLNSVFLNAFNNTSVQNELYPPSAYTTGVYNAYYQAALLAYALARNNTSCPS